MIVCVERPPPAPDAAGTIVNLTPGGGSIASTVRRNPLDSAWRLPDETDSRRVLTWSGTLAADLFQADPRTWMTPGRAALDAFCDRLAPTLVKRELTLCFQPHARHVLSDPPSSHRFLLDHAGGPFEVALAPASMLEPGMLEAADDHLARAFEILGPRCAMVFLHDVVVAEDADRLDPVPLGQGRLASVPWRRLLEAHVPPTTPVVLQPAGLAEQLALLGVDVDDAAGLSDRAESD